jgi:hypothetical protein
MPGRQPQSQANSLLNLLNPYQQSTRDVRVRHFPRSEDGMEPESPSAMLLRELQGDSEDDQEEDERDRYRNEDREGMSPTPTPSRSMVGLGLATNTTSTTNTKTGTTTTTTSSEDGDQPPLSLLYSKPPADRVISHTRGEESPGPFRQPAGSSSSISASRSASTSPGPSTISNYASGLDLDLDLAATAEQSTTSPISPTTSKHVPTFRERPGPSRTISGSSSKRAIKSVGETQREGYLDPPLSSSRKGKGRGKARSVGGRKYHQVPQNLDDQPDSQSRRSTRQGLNDYEKALWKWVNVDDLDGFLQEVSQSDRDRVTR